MGSKSDDKNSALYVFTDWQLPKTLILETVEWWRGAESIQLSDPRRLKAVVYKARQIWVTDYRPAAVNIILI